MGVRRCDTILLVEMDSSHRARLHAELTSSGFEVISAYDMADAVIALSWTRRAVRAVVIILDIGDPIACEQCLGLLEARPGIQLFVVPRLEREARASALPRGSIVLDGAGDVAVRIASAIRPTATGAADDSVNTLRRD